MMLPEQKQKLNEHIAKELGFVKVRPTKQNGFGATVWHYPVEWFSERHESPSYTIPDFVEVINLAKTAKDLFGGRLPKTMQSKK